MYKTYSITSDNGRYEISALITPKGFEMPSLYEKPTNDNDLTSDYTIADSPLFLTKTLYDKLKECVEKDDYSDFDEWYQNRIPSGETYGIEHACLPEILEMLDEALKLGFFKEYQNG